MQNILSLSTEIVATLFESFVIFYTIAKIFKPKCSQKNQVLIIIGAYSFISLSTILFNLLSSPIKDVLDIVVVLMYVAVSLLLFKGDKFLRIIVPIILMIIILIVNITVNISMSRLFNASPQNLLEPGGALRTIGLFITKFMFFLIAQIIIRKFKKSSYVLNFDEWIGLCLIFLISALTLFSVAQMQYDNSGSGINIIVLIYGIALINIAVFIFINKITKKNKQLTMMKVMAVHSDEQSKAFKSIEEIYKSMKIMKHDMKNEWIVVYQALTEGKIDEAKAVAKKMLDSKIDSFKEYVDISNPSINAILNYKLNYAVQNGIKVTSCITEDFDDFEDYDITVLIANLLDNAIEAEAFVRDPFIDIMITTKMNYLGIVVSNKIDKSVLKFNKDLKTTKSDTDNHGLGTKGIEQICEKYNGMLDYYEKENLFVADVMLKKQTPIFDKKLPNTN